MSNGNNVITETRFMASLSGSNVLPSVATFGNGTATFRWVDKRILYYTLSVQNLNNIVSAHIHLGTTLQNGPIVVTLFPTLTSSSLAGPSLNVSGRITAAMLEGPLQDSSLSTLVKQMKAGRTYVQVHTVENPAGAIRGQIRKTGTVQVPTTLVTRGTQTTVNNTAWRDGSWSSFNGV